MEMPVSYNGGESYIFFSYAHKDSRRVFPIIRRLQQDGFRVWYDDGIVPGTEWDDNIAEHVVGCACFVAALSENYMASDNCKDELQFSRDLKKPQVLLYLEDVALPSGMAMRLGNVPKTYFYKQEETAFYSELYQLKALYGLEDTELSEFASTARKKMTRRRILGRVVAGILAAAVSVGGALLYRNGQNRESASTEPAEQPQMMLNEVLVDNDRLTLTALGTEINDSVYTLNVLVENKMETDMNIFMGDCYINRYSVGSSCNISVTAGESELGQIYWSMDDLASAGILPEDVTVLEGKFGSYSGQMPEEYDSFAFYPLGGENVKYYSYTPKEGDKVLLDTEDYLLVVTDHYYDAVEKRYNIAMIAQNRTDILTRFMFWVDSINGYQYGSGWGPEVPEGCTLSFLWGKEAADKMSTVGGPQFFVEGGIWLETDDRTVLLEQPACLLPDGETVTKPAGWVSDIDDDRWDENDVIMMFWNQLGGENVRKILEFDIPAMYFGPIEKDGYTYDRFEVWNRTDEEKDVKFVAMVGNSVAEIPMHMTPNDVQAVYLLRNSRYGKTQPYTAMIALPEVDENGNYEYADLQYMHIRLDQDEDQILFPME